MNTLENSSSPFIRLHADDPIDWQIWDKETLKSVRTETKPIFLYIGTLASAWCINMQKESFQNLKIVNLISAYFTPIIVDREEHPELEHLYGNAVQAMTGKSGRPLCVFLTPDLKPFFGGSYFPMEAFQNLPAFETILENIGNIWADKRASFMDSAETITLTLEKNLKPVAELPAIDDEEEAREFDRNWVNFLYNDAFKILQKGYNKDQKGFSQGGRFPFPERLQFLMRYFVATDNIEAMDMVTSTLTKIANSALVDQLGGGFHRYTLDGDWARPNFEKFLSDNAMLVTVFNEAYQMTENPLYEQTISKVLTFIIDQMTDDETGAFYTSMSSADENSETDIYRWNREELIKLLEIKDADLACAYFNIPEEGEASLTQEANLEEIAKVLEIEESSIATRIIEIKRKLWEARQAKAQPYLDRKTLVSDNALMISAMAKASGTFEEISYRESATLAMNTLLKTFVADNKVTAKSFYKESFGPEATLEDYAYVINALIDLYEVTFNLSYLKQADRLLQTAIKTFWNVKVGTFLACQNSTHLLFNYVPYFDQAAPSALASITNALVRLETLTSDADYSQKLNSIVETIKPTLFKLPAGMLYLISALYSRRVNKLEMAVSGDLDNDKTKAILSCIHGNFVPARTVVSTTNVDQEAKDRFRILNIKTDETPSLYFCHQGHADEAIVEVETVDYILRYYSESAALSQ